MACATCGKAGHNAKTCGQSAAKARKATTPPAKASTNGAGRYAIAIADLEAQAVELEGKAKDARECAAALRKLA